MEKNLKLLPLSISNINEILSGKSINNIEEVVNKDILKALDLTQGILYNYDSLIVGNIEELDIDLYNLMEGKFFSENRELNIINEDEVRGHLVLEESKELIIEENYEIYDKNFNKLKVKKYLGLDEDGQSYVKYLKPCKLYRKEQK